MPTDLLTAIVALVGVVIGAGIGLLYMRQSFQYGSSAGSRGKDALIGDVVRAIPPPAPPPVVQLPPVPDPKPPAPQTPPAAPQKPVVPPPATDMTGATYTAAGKCSWFGGPNDTGVAADEDLALCERSEVGKFPGLFLAAQPAGTVGTARRLDPDSAFIAMRWDYKRTNRSFLQAAKVTVQANGRQVTGVQPIDWGPAASTGRIADLSMGLMTALGITTDDTVTVIVPLPGGAVAQQQPPAQQPASGEPPWLTWARGEIGFHEGPDNTGIQKYTGLAGYGAEHDPWCSIFLGAAFRAVGVPITGLNAMAQSVITAPSFAKIDSPRIGCVAVFWRGTPTSGTGHVGFWVGQADNTGHINVLGGNENDQVMIESLPTSGATMGLLGYYWPTQASSAEPKLV